MVGELLTVRLILSPASVSTSGKEHHAWCDENMSRIESGLPRSHHVAQRATWCEQLMVVRLERRITLEPILAGAFEWDFEISEGR